jgi:hypothetical protein
MSAEAITFHNVRSQGGWVWLRHSGWETWAVQGEARWSASELYYRFRTGHSLAEVADGFGLTIHQAEATLRHEINREGGFL